ncbi:MAG: Fe-S cluster assembly protein IscX [Nitrospirota bacterium]|nr:Fe-S cluster assembly protein IscX [Nitrospirota bacterium]
MAGLNWNSSEDIAFELIQRYPDKDPLSLRFTDLHKMIVDLPDFADDPKKASEGLLESIQMTWYEEYEGMQGDM